MPKLITITPFKERWDMLPLWIQSIKNSPFHHLLVTPHPLAMFNPVCPRLINSPQLSSRLTVVRAEVGEGPDDFSIGLYHNEGARVAKEMGFEWMMKWDVDAIPFPSFWEALQHRLKTLQTWTNLGFVYMTKFTSEKFALEYWDERIRAQLEKWLKSNLPSTTSDDHLPAASQFVCRVEDYLELGGCLPAFKGYGWEDYQQIYMLARHYHRQPLFPLKTITPENVTQLMKEYTREIARKEWEDSGKELILFHRWHRGMVKDPIQVQQNRMTLYHYVKEKEYVRP